MNWPALIELWIGINRFKGCPLHSVWQHGKAKRIKRHGWTPLEIAG